MTSPVDICNIALARLGANAIRDFEENNKQARACEALYAYCRDYLLSKYNWSFSRRIVRLERLEGSSALGIIYKIPSDCISAISIHPNNRFVKWEIIGDTIHSNLSSIVLKYTKKVSNPSKFTPSFVYALAEFLAAKLATSIIQDKEIASQLMVEAMTAINMAIEEDANLGQEQRIDTENLELDSFIQQDYGTGYGQENYYGDLPY